MQGPIASISDFRQQFWAISPECLADLSVEIRNNLPTAYEQQVPGYEARVARLPSANGAIAVLPIRGVLSYRGFGGLLDLLIGGTSLDEFSKAFDRAIGDKGVGAVVLDIDSPGGSVMGLTEAASRIRAGREAKSVVAVANPTALSAAYWLGSAASQMVVMPSGQVGSIGVYREHVDVSEAEEAAGIKTTFIAAGEHKVEDLLPLTDESRGAMQSQVDAYYDSFVGDVAKGRGVTAKVVREAFGKGRSVNAANAMASGMVDRVATLEEVISGMSRSRTPRRDAASLELKMMEF